MSIFPFTQDVPELEERAAQELPVFRELAYDYENNCLKRKGGKPIWSKRMRLSESGFTRHC